MDIDDVRAFATRDWAAVEAAEVACRRERRERLGPTSSLVQAAELAAAVRTLRPDWPSAEERRADLETHIRVGDALRRAHRA